MLELIQLIRSMTKNEKRYFMLQQGYLSKEDKDYITLYKVLNKTNISAEQILLEVKKKNLQTHKSNLLNHLLNSLIKYKGGNVFTEMAKLKELSKRGALKTAKKQINKILKTYDLSEYPLLQVQLNDIRLDIETYSTLVNPYTSELLLLQETNSQLLSLKLKENTYKEISQLIQARKQGIKKYNSIRGKALRKRFPILDEPLENIPKSLLSLHLRYAGGTLLEDHDFESGFQLLQRGRMLAQSYKIPIVDQLEYLNLLILSATETNHVAFSYSLLDAIQLTTKSINEYNYKNIHMIYIRSLEACVKANYEPKPTHVDTLIAIHEHHSQHIYVRSIYYAKYKLAEYFFQKEDYYRVIDLIDMDFMHAIENYELSAYKLGALYILSIALMELNQNRLAMKYINNIIYTSKSAAIEHQKTISNIFRRMAYFLGQENKHDKVLKDLYNATQHKDAAMCFGSKVIERYCIRKLGSEIKT